MHGHQDPETLRLKVYSPTPQTETLMLFLQALLNLGLPFSIADLKQACL